MTVITQDKHVTRCGNCGGWILRANGCSLCRIAETTLERANQ